MNIVEIINKKRLKQELTYDEIKYVIDNYVNDNIMDYQMSSLLMAIVLNGMTDNEIFDLTDCMLKSGDTIDLTEIDGIKVDKHSTGGVGDKTTLVLLPLVASTGVIIPKMSGRGLGFTGGTIDKLESIEGFKTNLTHQEFVNQIKKISVALTSQSGNLVPADKKIYALRDVTGTVESLPLIASSIMSKKLASASDKIVIDLKVGQGALMKDIESAKKLAEIMVKIGKKYNKKTVCVLTNMDEPLGNAIGNGLEVLESIETLKNNGPEDLKELVLTLGTKMVSMAKNITDEEARKELLTNLENNKAYEKFEELVKCQGGNIDKITISDKIFSIKSNKTGFINEIKTETLGEIVRKIGGGRYNKLDSIDHGVGIVLSKKVGDYILEDEELLKIYLSDKDITISEILDCFEIKESSKKNKLIYEIIE